MADAPIVRLLDHPADAGYLLEWHRTAKGWQARVSWIEVVPGHGLDTHEDWLPASQVEELPGEDYRKVPQTRE